MNVGQKVTRVKSHPEFNDTYLFCRLSMNQYCLINIDTGNRWTEPFRLNSPNIDKKKFISLVNNSGVWETPEWGTLILEKEC